MLHRPRTVTVWARASRQVERCVIPLILVASLALGGCTDDPVTPEPPTVAGQWSGSMDGLTFSMLLTQDESQVTGTGQGTGGSEGSDVLTITGVYLPPNVSLTIESSVYSATNFTGVHSEHTITGHLNGGGFENRPLTLTRSVNP